MALMNEGYMSTDTISLLTNNADYYNVVRRNLLKNECIIKRKRTVSYQGIKRVVNYIAITPKGVQWLIDNCSNQYLWLKYLPNPVPDFSFQHVTNDVQFHRNIKTITASIIFSLFEIKTYRIDEQINDTKNTPFKTMINDAKKVCGFMWKLSLFKSSTKAVNFIAEKNYDNDDAFFYSKDISKIASLTEQDINQYLFSSYIGLLSNCSVNYLIYRRYFNYSRRYYENTVLTRRFEHFLNKYLSRINQIIRDLG